MCHHLYQMETKISKDTTVTKETILKKNTTEE